MPETPTKAEILRLQRAINWSYRQLKPFRENDMQAMQQYVGSHYSEHGSSKKVPFSLMELAISTYTQRLSGGRPRVLATTPHRQLKAQAAKLKRGINNLLEEIDFHETVAEVVQAAFFSMGILKTGLQVRGSMEWNGFMHDVTQPFADSVTLDNWVHDMAAARWDKIQFCGDRYCIDLEDGKDIFKHGDNLKALSYTGETQADRTNTLSKGSDYNREDYREQTEVWDVWDPRKNIIIVLAAGEGDMAVEENGEYIDVADWNGPERGPYRLLRFNPVRGNIMPVPPVGLWRDMHELANNIMRKLDRQARRQKSVYGVRPGGEPDGNTAMTANDGDMVKLMDPKNVTKLDFPGVDPQMLAFLIQLKNMASWLWGNLDALGGLSPQADTLGQDRLLSASASQRLVMMQNTVLTFTTGSVKGLGELLYTDPFIVLPQTKRYANIEVPVLWTPEDREADFIQYNFTIEPYSLQYRSPSERLETIRQTMLQIAAPFAQQMMGQGVDIDFEKLFRIIGEYTGMDEMNDIMIYTNPRHTEEGPVRAMQSPVTNRINTRVNRPGATSQGKDEAMVNNLMGFGQQPAQSAQMARPTG
uniref:Portal protein n=1 Tax=viral metagenome TaxID=1070528 RepID=A0A6M3LNT0_9ZZZZ